VALKVMLPALGAALRKNAGRPALIPDMYGVVDLTPDLKAGLAITSPFGLPVKYVGVGEAADDLEAPVESPVSGEDQEEGLLPLEFPEELLEGESFQEGDGRAWYVVHCYSGYENKVRHNLEQRIESMGMKDRIFDVVVPTEEEIEVKEGKRRTVDDRLKVLLPAFHFGRLHGLPILTCLTQRPLQFGFQNQSPVRAAR
jgi:hypothetical protein